MTKFNRILMALFAIVMVSLGAGCGGGSVSGPSDVPTPTAHVTITFTVFDEANQLIKADASGVWHISAGKPVWIMINFANPGNVPFTGTITYWQGKTSLNNSTREGIGGLMPKGRQEVVVDITESNDGHHRTATAAINGD